MQSDRPPQTICDYTPIIIWMGFIQSLEHARILATWTEADTVTNTAVLLDLFGRPALVALLILCPIAAAAACLGKVRSLTGLALCLWPQQALQTIAAMGAFKAIWLGMYADGLVRSPIYILQDQMSSVWFVVGHALAVWQLISYMRRP